MENLPQVIIPKGQQAGNVFTFHVTFDNIKTDLKKNTVVVLKTLARALRLKGYSKMKKQEIVDLLKQVFVFEGEGNVKLPNMGKLTIMKLTDEVIGKVKEKSLEIVINEYNKHFNKHEKLAEIEMDMVLSLDEPDQIEVKKTLEKINKILETDEVTNNQELEKLIEKLDGFAIN